MKPPHYDLGDVVMVAVSPAATGQSRKLAAKAKGEFKVTAVLPNGCYEVQGLRDLKWLPNQRSVVAVVFRNGSRLTPWSRLVS